MVKQIRKQRPKNIRQLRPYLKKIEQIDQLSEPYRQLSDEQLQHKTIEFKERIENGETIHDLAVEAFATVREASYRVLGLTHYTVQLLGGLALLDGNIAEMRTGEGKTLVASLPSYLVGLEGKGVHVITVNDYLAKRDRELIGQIHEFLGLTVGLNVNGLSPIEKQAAYACDITYGVGTEFGFDYLRDHMAYSTAAKVQRPYHFAIIDEIDSILIDEARTPLIVAGKDKTSSRLYKVTANVIKTLERDEHYNFDPELRFVNFTEEGINHFESMFSIDNLFDLEHATLFHALLQSLRASVLFKRDVDYIVEDGEIKLIDMNTGRVMEGRSLSDGLHQAIEAKEGLIISEENKTQASITIQNYFRMYPTLSGMTGTAATEKEELLNTYNLDVIIIPPNKKDRRIDLDDVVFQTAEDKYAHILREVQERHAKGQPILIGTTSVLQSEEVAKVLKKARLQFQLLNAKSVEKEAQFIALAGQKGMITIATNMAGRGTDIMLGEGIDELGGLHVIGVERNESARIDNQLKGRAGRQGDPGSSQFIISLEDELFTRHAADELERLEKRLRTAENGRVLNKNITKIADTAQRISEGVHAQYREFNLRLEDILYKHQEIMYQFRNYLLEAEYPLDYIVRQLESLPVEVSEPFIHDEFELIDIDLLEEDLNRILLTDFTIDRKTVDTKEAVVEAIQQAAETYKEDLLAHREDEEVQQTAFGIALPVIDTKWKSHLETMTKLKEGIGLRHYQQEDPYVLFETEGFALFEKTFFEMKYDIGLKIQQYIHHITERREEDENV